MIDSGCELDEAPVGSPQSTNRQGCNDGHGSTANATVLSQNSVPVLLLSPKRSRKSVSNTLDIELMPELKLDMAAAIKAATSNPDIPRGSSRAMKSGRRRSPCDCAICVWNSWIGNPALEK